MVRTVNVIVEGVVEDGVHGQPFLIDAVAEVYLLLPRIGCGSFCRFFTFGQVTEKDLWLSRIAVIVVVVVFVVMTGQVWHGIIIVAVRVFVGIVISLALAALGVISIVGL